MSKIQLSPSVSHYSSDLSEYIPKNEFAQSEECPITESQFNWLFKQREQNGFAEAFVKVNARNYLLHKPTFIRKLAERRGA